MDLQLKRNMHSFHIIVLVISITSLVAAYIVQFGMGLAPCPLCIYQRFPYFILVILSVIGLRAKRLKLYYYYIAVFICAILLAGYHSGVERGYFELLESCKLDPNIQITQDTSVEEFKEMLEGNDVPRCDKPELVVLGLSMAEWNLLLNILLLITLIKFKFRNRESA